MGTNINCQYCDGYLFCSHPARKKFLWIFKRQCIYISGQLSIGQTCLIQKKFPEPDIRRIERRLKLHEAKKGFVKRVERRLRLHKAGRDFIQRICINCQFYNEDWEKEWEEKEHSWCKKKGIDILNDKKSEELGYCRHFVPKRN